MPLPAASSLRRSTWLVIPAYDEAERIGEVVGSLLSEWPRVLVIDDGSTDGTAAAARAAGATVLVHVVNRGQGAALQTGFAWCLRAGAEIVVTFDADGQHRSSDVGRLVEPVTAGECDVALGSRFLEPGPRVPPLRRLLLRSAVLFTRLTTGLRVTDTHNGLRALSRPAVASLRLRMDRMAHASEILDQIASLGLRYREVPVRIDYTRYSLAKGQRGLAAVRVLLDYLLGRLLG